MNTRELSSIAIKITGIVFLASAAAALAPFLISVYKLLGEHSARSGSMELYLFSFRQSPAGFVVGSILFFKGDRIAAFMVREPSDVSIDADANSLMSVGVAIVGVYLIATAIPRVVYQASILILRGAAARNVFEAMILFISQVIIGLWLFLGNERVVRLFKQAREAGWKQESPPEDN